jgi:OOP family OmpA-OmpF porin
MKKNLLLIILFVVVSCKMVQAQNKAYPWQVGFGMSAPQFTIGDAPFHKEYFNVKNWNAFPSFNLKVARHIKYGISAQSTLSVGYAERRPKIDNDGNAFIDFDINIKYSFANGYILKDKCFFDPYIVLGGGYNRSFLKHRGTVDLGAGFNIWIFKHFGLFMQASYNLIPKKFDASNPQNFRGYMHHTFGFVTRFGKGADRDKDGIADIDDKCPDVPGLKEFNGCPDTDGDGIVDELDACPTVAGIAAFAGCPDTDGDGITDALDKCPALFGPKETDGCPDTDGDGILDKDDACPSVKGLAQFKGCPDTDGDGVADKDDRCPETKGLVELSGCTDKDGDGVADIDDKCPDQKGLKDNAGCPKISEVEKKQVQEKLNFAAKKIEFETGSDMIRKASYATLDGVIEILQSYSDVEVSIDGHTDNTGKADKNLDLSIKRASSVYNYFVSKGVNANRLNASGYGQDRPIANNNSADGRQKNRRVELNIK